MTHAYADDRPGYQPAVARTATPTRDRLGSGMVRAYFDQTSPGILRLAFVGGLLSILTLGIYRFWFITHLRRQLWRRSALGGSNFEYTGTVKEIFVGFLIMLAILVPIYMLSLIGQLQYGLISEIASIAFVIVFFFFIAFATYRARRYRLTRTLWRGVRFGQTGSAAIYAVRALLWTIATSVTVGLILPFFRASQERYRVRHTWYGDRQFSCRASGWAMFLPWLMFLAVSLGPTVFAVARVFLIAPLDVIGTYFVPGVGADGMPTLHFATNAPAAFREAVEFALFTIFWLVVVPFLLWPFYRAMELRSFIKRTKLGEVGFSSNFSGWSIYGSYIMLALLAVVAIGAISTALVLVAGGFDRMTAMSPVEIGSFLAAYLLAVWIIGALKVWLVTTRLWARLVGSITVDGIEHLAAIGARRDNASAVGDDFASSYDFGAI